MVEASCKHLVGAMIWVSTIPEFHFAGLLWRSASTSKGALLDLSAAGLQESIAMFGRGAGRGLSQGVWT
jgi:hypothetical protein